MRHHWQRQNQFIPEELQILCHQYIGNAQCIQFPESTIIKHNQRDELLALLCMQWKSRFVHFEPLCSHSGQGLRYGFREYCLSHKNLLIMLQDGRGRQYGAYSSIEWEAIYALECWDKNAFLIQFSPYNGQPFICPIDQSKEFEKNVFTTQEFGPLIGAGPDFTLASGFNVQYSFEWKNADWISIDCANANNIKQMEVFRVWGV